MLVKGRDDKTGGSDGVAGDSNGSEDGLFKMMGQLLECLVVQIVAEHDKLDASRTEDATPAAGDRQHAACVFGKHVVDGLGPVELVELCRATNAHRYKPRRATVATARIDSIDQHALRSEARGGVDGLGKRVVDELADIERRDIFVAVDTKPASTAEDVVAGGIAHAVLHDSTVLGAVVDLVDIVDIGLEVIGMDARFPVIVAVVDMLRRKTEIAHGAL